MENTYSNTSKNSYHNVTRNFPKKVLDFRDMRRLIILSIKRISLDFYQVSILFSWFQFGLYFVMFGLIFWQAVSKVPIFKALNYYNSCIMVSTVTILFLFSYNKTWCKIVEESGKPSETHTRLFYSDQSWKSLRNPFSDSSTYFFQNATKKFPTNSSTNSTRNWRCFRGNVQTNFLMAQKSNALPPKIVTDILKILR